MSQSPPSTLGKYQIIREIARSNDIVYEAFDPVMGRRVAVKELAMPPGSTDQQREDRIARFLREARAAGSLVHPNIVTVYEVAEDAGRRYIAMEYLDGHNLRNLLDTKGLVEPKRAVDIAVKVLAGLEFAHSKGVVHRDIKPDNIQLLESGEVKITDFGIARLTFEPNLTMDGQVFGTPSYMSPEQINGREIDARSDLFSLGVILYECVTGQKPFAGDSVVAITYAIMNKAPDRPAQCNHALWQVIEKALDKSPGLRFSGAKEMAQALRAAEATFGQVVVDPVIALPPVSSVPPPSPYGPGTTPYGTPIPGTIQQTPGSAPGYPAPYGQTYGQPYGQQYGSPGGQSYGHPYGPPPGPPSGAPQYPVYYPPPPRPLRPLLTPHARQTLWKLAGALALVGCLAALVYVGIQLLAAALQDAPGPAPARERFGGASAEPTPEARPDPRAVARELVAQAVDEPSSAERGRLWARAATAWAEVVASSPDSASARRDAVSDFLTAAQNAVDNGWPDRAREAFNQAEGFALGSRDLSELVRDRRRSRSG